MGGDSGEGERPDIHPHPTSPLEVEEKEENQQKTRTLTDFSVHVRVLNAPTSD
jgi:hypothetical protein